MNKQSVMILLIIFACGSVCYPAAPSAEACDDMPKPSASFLRKAAVREASIAARTDIDALVAGFFSGNEGALSAIKEQAKNCIQEKNWPLLRYLLQTYPDLHHHFIINLEGVRVHVNELEIWARIFKVLPACLGVLAEFPLLGRRGAAHP